MTAPTGTDLAARLAAHEDAILAAVLRSAAPRSEPPHEAVTAALVAAVVRLALGAPEDDAVRDAGRRYAACGVSHAHAVHELHRTIIEMSRRWWESVTAVDVSAMLVLTQAVDDGVERMRAGLSDGYCAALAASGTRSLGRRQLAESLLTGRPAGPVLLRAAGVEPAGCYLVLSVTVHAPPDDLTPAMGTPGVLVHSDGDRTDVLVPVGRRSLDHPAGVAEQAFARLAAATGVTVAGAGAATREALPGAVEEARRTLRIATACGRSGAVLAGQLLVERAITGSRPAVRELAGLIGSLARWPHLPATLAALYQHDLDRSATADHLHIARRTLTKRLDRIHQLTGIRPTSAHGVQTFVTALAASRLTVPAPVPAPVRAPVRAC